MSQIKFNSFKYLRSGDEDGFLYNNRGVFYTVNANWNSDGWNLNVYSVENPNEWNADNQIISRNYCFSPVHFTGVLFCKPFFQPPSIRPTSSNLLDISIYFSLGISLFSQAS